MEVNTFYRLRPVLIRSPNGFIYGMFQDDGGKIFYIEHENVPTSFDTLDLVQIEPGNREKIIQAAQNVTFHIAEQAGEQPASQTSQQTSQQTAEKDNVSETENDYISETETDLSVISDNDEIFQNIPAGFSTINVPHAPSDNDASAAAETVTAVNNASPPTTTNRSKKWTPTEIAALTCARVMFCGDGSKGKWEDIVEILDEFRATGSLIRTTAAASLKWAEVAKNRGGATNPADVLRTLLAEGGKEAKAVKDLLLPDFE